VRLESFLDACDGKALASLSSTFPSSPKPPGTGVQLAEEQGWFALLEWLLSLLSG